MPTEQTGMVSADKTRLQSLLSHVRKRFRKDRHAHLNRRLENKTKRQENERSSKAIRFDSDGYLDQAEVGRRGQDRW